jgi:hypothetical protein
MCKGAVTSLPANAVLSLELESDTLQQQRNDALLHGEQNSPIPPREKKPRKTPKPVSEAFEGVSGRSPGESAARKGAGSLIGQHPLEERPSRCSRRASQFLSPVNPALFFVNDRDSSIKYSL